MGKWSKGRQERGGKVVEGGGRMDGHEAGERRMGGTGRTDYGLTKVASAKSTVEKRSC